MRIIVVLFFIGCGVIGQTQEALEALKYSQRKTIALHEKSSLNESFIYLIDTLELPLVDDFSSDRYKSYEADTSQANVSDTTWYAVEIAGTPEPWGTTYMTDTTYRYEFDTVPGYGFDSIKVDTIALTSTIIDFYDLDTYPIATSILEVWPTTYTFDSLWTATSPDITLIESSPDITQDSATIYFVHPIASDTAVYWVDRHTFRNSTLMVNSVSIGVASFDGLDEMGYPYDWTSASAFGVADYLTSKPINLFEDPSGFPYSPADQIGLTFKYQPGGLGDDPELQDSLVVEFWAPDSAQWYSVWNTGGFSSAQFTDVVIPVTNSRYLKNGFKFRFKNYGTLTGSLDHWHIDYVKLNIFNATVETNDVAFAYPLNSFLKDYTAMPWSHFVVDTVSPLLNDLSLSIFNNHTLGKPVNNSRLKIYHEGLLIRDVDQGTDPTVMPGTYMDLAFPIADSGYFDTNIGDTTVIFDCIFEYTNPDGADLTDNDTLRYQQIFDNYYAYDDGSAEAAYGLAGGGAELAYKFTLPAGIADTLRAVKLHFVSSVNDASFDPFFLQVWNDIDGEPGDLIYSTDDDNIPITFTPIYNIGVNAYWEYVLPESVVVNGTFYVGWKQTTAKRLNIGFDKNINHQDKIFYDLGSGWNTTGFQGSLMIRPVFRSEKDALYVGMTEEKEVIENKFTLYPNPANNEVIVEMDDALNVSFEMIDVQGRLIHTGYLMNNRIDLSTVPNGFYLVKIIDETGSVSTQKLSVRK